MSPLQYYIARVLFNSLYEGQIIHTCHMVMVLEVSDRGRVDQIGLFINCKRNLDQVFLVN